MTDHKEEQELELEALNSIYPEEFFREYWSLCSSQIEAWTSPLPGNAPGIWIFGKFLFKFLPHQAEKLFKYPHPWVYYQITVLTFQ